MPPALWCKTLYSCILLLLVTANADIHGRVRNGVRGIVDVGGDSDMSDITLDRSAFEHLERQYNPSHVNLTQCFQVFRAGGFGGVGSVYRNGTEIPRGGNTTAASGMTYRACLEHCGNGQPSTSWYDFSQDISAWFLPWVALLSQLPFGAKTRTQNISAMFLYIGSPALSAYSLILTLLNRYYVFSRFSTFTYPNAYYASHILADLQQAPLTINTADGLLASLVVLPQNDEQWFRSLRRQLKCEHGWSLAAFTSIAWVVVAYALTVSNAFIDVAGVVEEGSLGQTVGLMWLWLLPIVVGWLQLAPKCDADYLETTLKEVNQKVWVATDSEEAPQLVSSANLRPEPRYAIEFRCPSSGSWQDEDCTSPIFNYARIFSWSQAVERVAEIYGVVSKKRMGRMPVRGADNWEDEGDCGRPVHPKNRLGTNGQIVAYCTLAGKPAKDSLGGWMGPRVAPRIWLSSFLGLALQWLTVAGAMAIVYSAPTTGLSCRSAAYLLFGILGTLVWGLMIGSTFLAHAAEGSESVLSASVMASISRQLRRAGKCIAAFNSLWLITTSTLHFSGVFKSCFCAAGMPFRRDGHTTSLLCDSTQDEITKSWMIGILLAALGACAFIGVFKLFMDPPKCRKE